MFVAMLVLNKMCNVALSHADRMAVKDCLLGMHTILPVSRLLRSASKKKLAIAPINGGYVFVL